MIKYCKWLKTVVISTAAGSAIALSGCASQAPEPPVGIEQKISAASTRSDHENVATEYQRQAGVDAATAKQHYSNAAAYRRNTSQRSGVQVHENLAKHCEALAKTYEQAADQNLALAKLHRLLP